MMLKMMICSDATNDYDDDGGDVDDNGFDLM